MSKSREGLTNISVHVATHKRLVKAKERVAEYKLILSKWPLVTTVTLEDVIKVALDLFEAKYPKLDSTHEICFFESCEGACANRADTGGRHLLCVGHDKCDQYSRRNHKREKRDHA